MDAKKRKGSKRRAGELAQPSCSLVGLGSLFAQTAGDFAVIVHGDPDCANPFLKVFPHRLVPDLEDVYLGTHRFYCSDLSEIDVAAGKGTQRLLECARVVLKQAKPARLFLIGTCLSEMVGEDLDIVAQEVEEAVGVPTIGLSAGGLRLKTQAQLLDRFGQLMLEPSLAAGPSTGPGVTMLGYAPLRRWEREEFQSLLNAMGAPLVAELPGRASEEQWAAGAKASLLVVSDSDAWPGVTDLLAGNGTKILESPPPVGAAAATRFFDSINKAVDGTGGHTDQFAELWDRAGASMAPQADRLRGRKVAYCIGSIKNYEAGQLALEGLGDIPAFVDLGMEVEVLVQERDDQQSHERVQRNLAALGIDLPYRNFNDPGVLGEALKAGDFDLAYCQDHLKGQAMQAGLPYVRFGAMRPGAAGMVTNSLILIGAISEGFQGRYGRYLR